MMYVNTILQTPATDKTVLVKEHVPRTQDMVQTDTHVRVITATQETTAKQVGRMKHFNKDVEDLAYKWLYCFMA